MKWITLLSLFFLLTNCSTANTVKHIQSHDSVIKYSDKEPDVKRFQNLYPGKKTYPETCIEDCYPASNLVQCQSEGEQCTFIGKQLTPKINTPFTVRWIGHASFYIQTLNSDKTDSTSVLFDPVSKQFDWPVNWAFRLAEGFSRHEPTWLTSQEIETVDGVLYSHIHYDHFNKDDIERLGTAPQYYVPLNFAEHFSERGYTINEMAWYSSTTLNDLTVNFVPAHHFSSRILVPFLYEDHNKTLWGGWVLEQQGKRLFFAGDTGYSQHFKDIHERYGDMDVCLMPIASYFHKEDGEWYRYVHTTPEDALIAAQELNCKVMIPFGYGNTSWKMGDHSSHSPLLRLLKMHKELKSSVPLYILNEGEEVRF